MSEHETDLPHGERIRALERDVEHLDERMDRFETYCKETQQVYRESFTDMNDRIEKFLNHQITILNESIKDAKNTRREPLSRWDWTKIIAAIITVAGMVTVALIQSSII